MSFMRIRPFADQKESPGVRLVVVRNQEDDNVELREETVLPERVDRVDANRVQISQCVILTPNDMAWLWGVLGELLDSAVQKTARIAVIADVLRAHVGDRADDLALEVMAELELQHL